MKYIKQFELYAMVTNVTEEDIIKLCEEYDIVGYNINDDMSIDVYDDVHITGYGLEELPLTFNYISGDFSCADNHLTTLKGCPIKVAGVFSCANNKLISLKYSPIEVGNNFNCSMNKLTSLKYAASNVDGKIHCHYNLLPIDIEYLKGDELNILFKHQDEYDIWNNDGTFNKKRFDIFLKDLDSHTLS